MEIYLAACEGNVETLRALLDADPSLVAPLDEESTIMSPLQVACANGHLGAAEVLIERGAEVNLTTRGGFTALGLSSTAGNVEMIELLLRRGAVVMTEGQPLEGQHSLYRAAAEGRVEAVQVLLRHLKAHPRRAVLEWRAMYMALCGACQKGRERVLQLLLGEGETRWMLQWDYQGRPTMYLRLAQAAGHTGCANLMRWFVGEVERRHAVVRLRHMYDEAHAVQTSTRVEAQKAVIGRSSLLTRERLETGRPLPEVELKGKEQLRWEMGQGQGADGETSAASEGRGRREERVLLASLVLRHVVQEMRLDVFAEAVEMLWPAWKG